MSTRDERPKQRVRVLDSEVYLLKREERLLKDRPGEHEILSRDFRTRLGND